MKIMGFVFSLAAVLAGCSDGEAYSSEEAVKRGDVAVVLEEVKNADRWAVFLENMSEKKADNVRITGYTLEGDPIFQDLEFDGKVIAYRYDNSNDEFAGEGKGVETDVCKTIIETKKAEGKMAFTAAGCSSGIDHDLIQIQKDELKEGE
ncbi:DUF4362 domain-containing protein [Domibacillus indicus]|uniref:DUF4362 domain-containing protein n=1 Tax=Domibacillus indicus TaxID=1437523 RepID=UPI001E4AC42D|nr:DUF4362 domain-containing protein [Domibacillus indicus]